MGALAYTKNFTVTTEPQMILGKDTQRQELTVYNISDTDYIYIGFGEEYSTFNPTNSLPLAPGEAYDASVPPITAVFLVANTMVETVIYHSTIAPAYVKGLLYEGN